MIYTVREYRSTEEFFEIEASSEEEALELVGQGEGKSSGEHTMFNHAEIIAPEQPRARTAFKISKEEQPKTD